MVVMNPGNGNPFFTQGRSLDDEVYKEGQQGRMGWLE